MCLCGALCSIPFNLIRTQLLSEGKMFGHFDQTPGTEGVCKDRICACMVLYAVR